MPYAEIFFFVEDVVGKGVCCCCCFLKTYLAKAWKWFSVCKKLIANISFYNWCKIMHNFLKMMKKMDPNLYKPMYIFRAS